MQRLNGEYFGFNNIGMFRLEQSKDKQSSFRILHNLFVYDKKTKKQLLV